MAYGIYGGETVYCKIDADATKGCCTPNDGMKFFASTEQLLAYVADKCGYDVAHCFEIVDGDELYAELQEIYEEDDLP